VEKGAVKEAEVELMDLYGLPTYFTYGMCL
jgi:hypothetical protein